jgi:hypothetical protein
LDVFLPSQIFEFVTKSTRYRQVPLLSIFGHFQIDCSVMTLEQILQCNINHMFAPHASCVITFLGNEKTKLPFCSKLCYLTIQVLLVCHQNCIYFPANDNILVLDYLTEKHFIEIFWTEKSFDIKFFDRMYLLSFRSNIPSQPKCRSNSAYPADQADMEAVSEADFLLKIWPNRVRIERNQKHARDTCDALASSSQNLI